MTAKITIKIDNAAFEDAPEAELVRILRELARRIELGSLESRLMDYNGNRVGTFHVAGKQRRR